jgi:hypothetical protein
MTKLDLAYETIIMFYAMRGETVTRESDGITRAAVRMTKQHSLQSLRALFARTKKSKELMEKIKKL